MRRRVPVPVDQPCRIARNFARSISMSRWIEGRSRNAARKSCVPAAGLEGAIGVIYRTDIER
jgi:hypothetical protein